MSAGKTRGVRWVSAAVAALAVGAFAGSAAAQPLRLSELNCGRDLSNSASAAWQTVFPSARTNISDARRAAALNPGVRLDASTLARVEQARSECSAGLRQGNRYVADAYSCVAEASLLLAQQGQSPEPNLQSAACSFATVAHGARRQNAARAAEAEKGLGDALAARYALGGNAVYIEQAIRAYTNSLSQPSHAAYLALARAHASRGNAAASDGAYANLLALRPETGPDFTSQDRAAAFAARARLPGRSAADAQQYWQGSLAAFWTGEAAVELGKSFMAANDPRAESYFIDASTRPSPIGPSGVNYQLEANYFLSVLHSPPAQAAGGAYPPRSAWNRAYDDARRAETSQPQYRRQACLTHIARGGDDYVTRNAADLAHDEEVGRICTAGDPGAEGLLMRGMYYLRRAQHVPSENNTWRQYIMNAERAFVDGQALAVGANNRPLDWPGVSSQGLTLSEALQTGLNVVNYMRGRCEGIRPVTAVFERFDTVGCFPRLN